MTAWRGTPNRRGGHEPTVPIRLELPDGRRIIGLALVDSGAEFTIFPASLLAAYGVAWDSLVPVDGTGVGAGGEFEIRELDRVRVTYEGVEFAQEVAVGDPDKYDGNPLLGRRDFFATFDVQFAWHLDHPEFTVALPARRLPAGSQAR